VARDPPRLLDRPVPRLLNLRVRVESAPGGGDVPGAIARPINGHVVLAPPLEASCESALELAGFESEHLRPHRPSRPPRPLVSATTFRATRSDAERLLDEVNHRCPFAASRQMFLKALPARRGAVTQSSSGSGTILGHAAEFFLGIAKRAEGSRWTERRAEASDVRRWNLVWGGS